MHRHRFGRLSIIAALLAVGFASLSLAPPAEAQTVDSVCTYTRCALGIIPRLSALDVVRGASEQRVASLSFLWPRDLADHFRADSTARRHASNAVRLRRSAAVMTTAGALVAATGGAILASRPSAHRALGAGLAIAGSAAFGLSVPVHFAADAELSRAVWSYNAAMSGSLATARPR